jgi:aryl-alcohol dehydrogenase-like predicted oxidoreductase
VHSAGVVVECCSSRLLIGLLLPVRVCPAQVVLNWLVCQGNVVPIPGAKNAEQAREFAGALGWSLSGDEVEELRSMARQVKPVIGFPVEKL